MNKILNIVFLMLLMLTATACSTKNSKDDTKDVLGNEYNISYIDSNIFDNNVGRLITGQAKTVNIEMMGNVSVNDIPERLTTWLDHSASNGATINMVDSRDVPNYRGVAEDMLKSAYKYYKEYKSNLKYENTGDYDVDLIYERATGKLKNIIFRKHDKLDDEGMTQ